MTIQANIILKRTIKNKTQQFRRIQGITKKPGNKYKLLLALLDYYTIID